MEILAVANQDGNPPSSGPPPLVSDHELIKVIGAGACGEVWLARSVMGQWRAIKIVRRSAFEDDKPFEREYNGLKQFEPLSRSHDAFVDILHVGQDADRSFFYCVMELADSQTSDAKDFPASYEPKTVQSEITMRGHLPLPECISIGLALVSGLEVLHGQKLIHRDIKPSNIVFIEGQPKLADIGLVHSIAAAESFVGTQGYIPPEGPGTVQADIFSLGKVLYELSTGNDRQQFPELPEFFCNSEEGKLFAEFNEILLRACENQSSRRYATAAQLRADLEVLKEGQSVRRLRTLERRWKVFTRVGALAAVILALAGMGGWFLYDQHQKTERAKTLQVFTSISYGSQQMQDGKYFSGLSWFVDALRAGEERAGDRKTERMRVSGVLRYGPHLIHCWWQDSPVRFADFSPDGKFIAVADDKGSISIIERSTGKVAVLLRHGTNGSALSVKFSHDGANIVTIGSDRHARVWTFPDRVLIADFYHTNELHSADFSPDGTQLVTGSGGGTVLLWDIASRKMVRGFEGHGPLPVWNVSFSPDGREIVSAGADKLAIVWKVQSGKLRLRLPHSEYVHDAVFSPDGKLIATVCDDRSLRIYDAVDGRTVHSPMKHEAPLNSVRFSPDGRLVVTTCVDGVVTVWDLMRTEAAPASFRHGANTEYAVFSPDSRYVLTSSRDKTVRVWDPLGFAPSPVMETYSPDGSRVFVVAGSNVVVLAAGSRRELKRYGAPYRIKKLLLNTSGSRFLALPEASEFQELSGFDLEAQTELRVVSAQKLLATNWAIADQEPVAVQVAGSLGHAWQLRTGQQMSEWPSPPTRAAPVLSPAGDTAAVLSSTNVILFETQTGKQLPVSLPHDLPVSCATFNKNGKRLLTGCADGLVTEGYACIWDVASGKPLSKRLMHRDGVIAVAFSPDEKLVATGGEDSVARVWNVESGESLPPLPHLNQVRCLRFNANGRYLATGSLDNSARMWEVSSSTELIPPLWHPTAVDAVCFVEGRDFLVTTAVGGRTRLWDISPDTNEVLILSVISKFLAGLAPLDGVNDQSRLNELARDYSKAADMSAQDWHGERANLYDYKKHYFAAAFHWQKLIELRGPSDALYLRLANVRAEMGDWKAALNSYCLTSAGCRQENRAIVGTLQLMTNVAAPMEVFPEMTNELSAANLSRYCWWLVVWPEVASNRNTTVKNGLTQLLALESRLSPVLGASIHSALGNHGAALARLNTTGTTNIHDPDLLALCALICAEAGERAASESMAKAIQESQENPITWEQRIHLELIRRRWTNVMQSAFPQSNGNN